MVSKNRTCAKWEQTISIALLEYFFPITFDTKNRLTEFGNSPDSPTRALRATDMVELLNHILNCKSKIPVLDSFIKLSVLSDYAQIWSTTAADLENDASY